MGMNVHTQVHTRSYAKDQSLEIEFVVPLSNSVFVQPAFSVDISVPSFDSLFYSGFHAGCL